MPLTTTPAITATPVPDDERMDFLPEFFGARLMLLGETLIYTVAKGLCPTYNGDSWLFYRLSNGGFYMAPRTQGAYLIHCENGFAQEVPADTAGVIITSQALNQLACNRDPEQARFIELYHALRAFAIYFHPDRDLIAQAMD